MLEDYTALVSYAKTISFNVYYEMYPFFSYTYISCIYFETVHHFSEEWEWIKNLGSEEVVAMPTTAQLKFQKALSSAIKNLLTLLEVPPEQTGDHR